MSKPPARKQKYVRKGRPEACESPSSGTLCAERDVFNEDGSVIRREILEQTATKSQRFPDAWHVKNARSVTALALNMQADRNARKRRKTNPEKAAGMLCQALRSSEQQEIERRAKHAEAMRKSRAADTRVISEDERREQRLANAEAQRKSRAADREDVKMEKRWANSMAKMRSRAADNRGVRSRAMGWVAVAGY